MGNLKRALEAIDEVVPRLRELSNEDWWLAYAEAIQVRSQQQVHTMDIVRIRMARELAAVSGGKFK